MNEIKKDIGWKLDRNLDRLIELQSKPNPSYEELFDFIEVFHVNLLIDS